jgi:ABC-type nitrate/sulfonate/bicarbonate transport system substrate-binding protein
MWRVLWGLVVLACALAGCSESAFDGTAEPGSAALTRVRIAATGQPQSILVHVAADQGYFAAEGLAVQILLRSHGEAAMQALLDGQADFATVADIPIMLSILRGDKIAVVAMIESSNVNNAIVANQAAGITQASDLRGKRIGFTPGTTSDFFLDAILTTIDLTRRQIQPVALLPEEMLQAMSNRQVDAVSTWNYPLTLIKQQLGTNGVVFHDRQIYTETFNVVVQQDLISQQPQTVQRLLRALIRAEAFVAAHPDQAQDLMAAAAQIDKATVQSVWANFNYRVELDRSLPLVLEDETRWAVAQQLTDNPVMPDFARHIHVDSLRAVKPAAVRLSR